MIIIEGMDNCGKTTFAERLAADLHLEYSHNTMPPKDDTAGRVMVENTLEMMNDPTIRVIDRTHCISDQVYAPILRGNNFFEDTRLGQECLLAFYRWNPMVVWCRPPLDTVLKSLGERAQMQGVMDQAQKLYAEYDRVMDYFGVFTNIRVHLYDWTDPDQYECAFNAVRTYIYLRTAWSEMTSAFNITNKERTYG